MEADYDYGYGVMDSLSKENNGYKQIDYDYDYI